MRRLEEAVGRVRESTRVEPRLTLILGPGSETLADEISVAAALPYGELHDFMRLSGQGELGRLLVGHLDGVPVAALQGALHRHQGFSPAQLAFPVRVMRLLAAPAAPPPPLLIGGSCVSLQPLWEADEVVLVEDHIGLTIENPLVGPNLDALGPRFPDLSEPYDRSLRKVAAGAAAARRIPLRAGVYVAVGPHSPTRAESEMLRRMGADVVGSGMVPEVIAARHMGMPTLAVLRIAKLGPREATGIPDESAGASAAADALSAVNGILREVIQATASATGARTHA